MARPDPGGDVPALRPPCRHPICKAHRGLTPLGSLPIDDTVVRARVSPREDTGEPCFPQPEMGKPHSPSGLAIFPSLSGYTQTLPTMRSPSAIAGKTLPGTPSTRNLVVGAGAAEWVSHGDGVARVGLTRGVAYHQKEKANLNRLQKKLRSATAISSHRRPAPALWV